MFILRNTELAGFLCLFLWGGGGWARILRLRSLGCHVFKLWEALSRTRQD